MLENWIQNKTKLGKSAFAAVRNDKLASRESSGIIPSQPQENQF